MSGVFYNNERKRQYLQECDYETETVKKIMTFFHKASTLEFLFDKDISEFSVEELESLFYGFKCKTMASIKGTVTLARRYVYWEISSSYLPSKNIILDLPRFKGHNLNSFINSVGNKASYLKSSDELYQLVSNLANPRDKAIICLLYEGVCGEDYYDLRHLKKQDCDFSSNTVRLMSKDRSIVERVVQCDYCAMDIVHEAIYTETYIKRNGTTMLKHDSVDLLPSDFVIRTSKGDGIASGKLITLTFEKLRTPEWDVDFYCQYLTPTTVRDSGLFNYAVRLEESKIGALTDTEFRNVLKYSKLSMK